MTATKMTRRRVRPLDCAVLNVRKLVTLGAPSRKERDEFGRVVTVVAVPPAYRTTYGWPETIAAALPEDQD